MLRLMIKVSREGSHMVVAVVRVGCVGHFLAACDLRSVLWTTLTGGVQRAGFSLLFPALTLC